MQAYDEDMPHFVNQLFANIQTMRDKLLHIPHIPDPDVDNYIFPTDFAFLKESQVKPSLEPKWLGPYPVIDTFYPVVRLLVDNQEKNVNIDLLKPAYILNPAEVISEADSEVDMIDPLPVEDPEQDEVNSDFIQFNPSSQYRDLYDEVLSQPVGPHVQIRPIVARSILR